MVATLPDLIARYGVVHDYRGPRIRLGVLWFAGIMASMLGGVVAVAALFSVTAALAAMQVATRWAVRRVPISPVVAGAVAGMSGLGALIGTRVAGLVLILGAAAALLLDRNGRPRALPAGPDELRERLPMAGATLRASLGPALVAVSVVEVHRIDSMAFLFLAAVVSVYDAGDYLIGAGYDQRLAGPLAGVAAGTALTAAMSVIDPPPLEGAEVWVVGLVVSLLAVLGPFVGTWTLPTARASAPALRRLDSWLLAAPLFLVVLWILT